MAILHENRWESRPIVAMGLKAAIYGAPVVLAAVMAYISQRVLAAHAPGLAWWGAALVSLVVASASLVLGERLARRVLPLVMLLRLSLVFPDRMPSRLGVALRAASPRRLARMAASDEYDAQSAEHVLALVSALNAHDRRTRGHSERVRALTMLVADELEIVGNDRDKLEWAALLHDVGKMSVPPEILNKPGRPDAHEWEVLQGHPAAGADFSSELHEWLGEWRHAIDQHHEKFDGSGYPTGIDGERIALSGRVVAVTDAFETMTATRSYKTPMSAEAARAELVRSSGSHFDPQVIRAFMSVSLSRIHRALGPVSWLTSLPFAGGVSGGVRIGSAIMGGAAAPVLAASIAAAAPAILIDRPLSSSSTAAESVELYRPPPAGSTPVGSASVLEPEESAPAPEAGPVDDQPTTGTEGPGAVADTSNQASPGGEGDDTGIEPAADSTIDDVVSGPVESLSGATVETLGDATAGLGEVLDGLLDPATGVDDSLADVVDVVETSGENLGSLVEATEEEIAAVVSTTTGGVAQVLDPTAPATGGASADPDPDPDAYADETDDDGVVGSVLGSGGLLG